MPPWSARWDKQVAQGRNKGCRESSWLRPQAEQIQDSAAAGSSLRQDNRTDCGRKKIRLSTVQFIQDCRRVEEGRRNEHPLSISVQLRCPWKPPSLRKKLKSSPLWIRPYLPLSCRDGDHESFLLFTFFFSNLAHQRDTGGRPPKQANTP